MTGLPDPLADPQFRDFLAFVARRPILLLTGQPGRTVAHAAAGRLWARRKVSANLRLFWTVFVSLDDWRSRWAREARRFEGAILFTPVGEPVLSKAATCSLTDLADRGKPALWGEVDGDEAVFWHCRFALSAAEEEWVSGLRYGRVLAFPAARPFSPIIDHWARDPLGLFLPVEGRA